MQTRSFVIESGDAQNGIRDAAAGANQLQPFVSLGGGATASGSPSPNDGTGSKFEQTVINSATEQKLWIQCTLNGAKHRGEDWIEPIFKDEESTGCSACLPDIVIVNDTKFSGSFASKAPAPWQRIFTKDEADNCIANHRSRAAPEAASTMPFCSATSIPDTYLYHEKRLICFFLYGQPSSMICNASCVLQVVRTRSENLRQILFELLF